MVPGTSITWNPCECAPMSSSADWYWGWFKVTRAVTSARIARSPNDVSV
jgi:hypothetical protein